MISRAEWIASAGEVLASARALLEPYGLDVEPALRIVADQYPCPGYLHETRTIGFCPPVVETGVDRVRWLFFRRCMGCETQDEVLEFYRIALPLVICHEVAHHLRAVRGLATSSFFVEEQVCDRIGVAILEAMPGGAQSIVPLRDVCERMRSRLARSYSASAGASYLPDVGDVLVATSALSPSTLERLEDLAERTDLSLEAVLELSPGLGPERMRDARLAFEAAQRHVDDHYTRDPAEYWHWSLAWVVTYLGRARRPPLVEIVASHLRDPSAARRDQEVELGLRELLTSPRGLLSPIGGALEASIGRAAAAEGLLRVAGPRAVPGVLDALHSSIDPGERRDLLAALVRSWPTDRSWDPSPLTSLLSSPATGADPDWQRLLLRLEARSGHPSPPRERPSSWPSGDRERALLAEALAADPSPDPALVLRLLQGEEHATALLDAWDARGRALGELPGVALDALGPRAWPLVLRLASRDEGPVAKELLARAVESLGSPGPADQAAARSLIDRAGAVAGPALAGSLPPRGCPGWSTALAALRDHAFGADLDRVVREGHEGQGEGPALRAACARADLADRPPAADAEAAELGRRMLGRARALLRLCDLATSDEALRFARDCLTLRARRGVLEVVRCLAPAGSREAVSEIVEEAWRSRPLDPVLRDLVAAAVPVLQGHGIARVLDGEAGADDAVEVEVEVELEDLGPPEGWILGRPRDDEGEDQMLSQVEKVVHLRSVPLFAGMDPDRLWELGGKCVVQRYDEGDLIVREGERGDQLFVVVAGQVAVRKEAVPPPVLLSILGPSSCFGEMALFDGAPRSASVRAHTECRLLTVSGREIARLGRECPEVYEGFLQVLSARLRIATQALAG